MSNMQTNVMNLREKNQDYAQTTCSKYQQRFKTVLISSAHEEWWCMKGIGYLLPIKQTILPSISKTTTHITME